MNPTCAHGERKYVTGTSAKGPWAAYMCPTPKGTPDQCAPVWTKDAPPAQPPASSAATELLSSIDSKLTIVVELLRDLSTRDIKF